MRTLNYLLLFFFIGLGINGISQVTRPIGTNLTAIRDYSPEFVFVDAFKQSRAWIPHELTAGAPWSSNIAVPLGPNGYPLEIPYDDGVNPPQALRTLLFFGDLDGIYPSGNYRLIVEGSGVVKLESGASGSYTCPIDTLINVSNTGGVFIDIIESSVSDPISKINFVMPGFHTSYLSEPFHPKFLDFIQDFQVIRFMDWMATNHSENEDWSDRNSPTYYTQTLDNGVAPEILIDLCNRELKDPWICIPHAATDDYMIQMANLLLNNLDTSLTIHIEYSNEVWNSIFDQNQYSIDMGTNLGYSGNPWDISQKYYAKRTADMFHIFDSVFVGTDRVVKVISSQAANSWLSNQILTYFNDPLYNPHQTTAHSLGIAPYFGGIADEIGDAGFANSCTVSQILDSMEANLPLTFQWMQENKVVADNYNLDLVAYEGGQHLVAGYLYHSNQAFVDKLIEANRHTRMTDLYCEYFNYWYDSVSPTLFCNFSSLQIPNKWGSWGVKEHFDDTLAPKYIGLQDCVFEYNTSSLSIEEELEVREVIQVFPNPTNSTVTVRFKDNQIENHLRIYTLQGRLIFSERVTNNQEIDLEMVESGVYYFEFSNEANEFFERKMMVKN